MLNLVLLATIAWAAWALLLFAGQRRMIYLHGGLRAAPGVQASLPGLRPFHIPIAGGEVDAWFLPPSGPTPAPALLFTHGNAELIDHSAPLMASFTRHGLGVMLLEYPGYGRSTGRPTESSIGEAALAAFDVLAAQPEVDASRIVAYGRSLGGGAAAALALQRPLAGLVLESAFTSLRSYAGRYFLPGFLVRDRFEVLESVRAFDGPVLVLHGRRDEIVPYAHGQALADAAGDATLVTYECGHNDCPPAWEPHVQRVVDFLAEKRILGR